MAERPGVVVSESTPLSDEEVLAAVALENQANAAALARDGIRTGLVWIALSVGVLVAGAFVGVLTLLQFPAIAVIATLALPMWRHIRVLREDPVARWRREQAEDQELRDRRYDFELRMAAVTPWATSALIGVIVAVTLVEGFTGGSAHAVPAAALVKSAARGGEWWRLLTAAFLHANIPHVVGNLLSLYFLGRLVEAYDQRSRVALVFLVSALGCSVASLLMVKASSLGASGGIVGLGSYLLTSAGVRKEGAPEWIGKRMWLLVLNLAISGIAGYGHIDNAGHAGGLLGGALVGLLMRSTDSEAHSRIADIAGRVAMAILVAVALFTVARLVL